jgi:hypothetical protein
VKRPDAIPTKDDWRELWKLILSLPDALHVWARDIDQRNRTGEFGKWPWQQDYGLWPWQRKRKP